MCSTKIAVVALMAFAVVSSLRQQIQMSDFQEAHETDVDDAPEEHGEEVAKAPEKIVKCNAAGSGLSVTWGLPKSQCMSRCGPRTKANSWTYEDEFARAFTVSLGKGCECSAGGKKILRFRAFNEDQASKCHADTEEMKVQCWNMYMRAKGTHFEELESIRAPYYRAPWTPTDFVVDRMNCGADCTLGEDCNHVQLTGAVEHMDRTDKAAVGAAAKKIMDGKANEVSDALKRLVEVLSEDDLDDAQFEAIDTNGDGTLSVAELSEFFTVFDTAQISSFVSSVDEDKDGEINRKEFKAFKEEMRNYNPQKDLIMGDIEFEVVDGEVKEVKAKWKAVQFDCMKGGVKVPASECEGTAEEAKEHFDKNCA